MKIFIGNFFGGKIATKEGFEKKLEENYVFLGDF